MSCGVGEATSQLILQPFFCFSYVTGFSLTSPGEPPMVKACGFSTMAHHLILLVWFKVIWIKDCLACTFTLPDSARHFLRGHMMILIYEQSSFSNPSITSSTSQLILQPITSLYLHHRSFCSPSVASPTSQLILQPFFRFSYVTGFSLTSPGEPPMNPIAVSYINR